jgi:5-(carboxyamino)imidazole ribonucleotide mutase
MIKKVAIIMGSQSDYPTMQNAEKILQQLGVEFHTEVVSAHRTPEKMMEFAKNAHNEYSVIIAGAGGAEHLPGMVAAMTHLPVLGVPIKSSVLSGKDSLLSIVQMPKGVAVGTLAIGDAGGFNAGLMAAQIIALTDATVQKNVVDFRATQTQTILDNPTPAL